MFRQATNRSLWLVSLCVVLFLSIMGCAEDYTDPDVGEDRYYDEWFGVWSLETFDGQSWDQLFAEQLFGKGVKNFSSSYSTNNNTWLFSFDGTWMAELDFQLSTLRLSRKVSSTYDLLGNRYTITWSKHTGFVDFLSYTPPSKPNTFGLIDGLGELINAVALNTLSDERQADGEPIDTGIWSRNDNTLTLTSDDGTTIVFKKKLSLISSLSRRSMNCTTA